ncbi:hypothetical protein BH11BAC4_BH11BAC4_25200 [soil metagenome]
MRFYARLVLICNVCFVLAAMMWSIETYRRAQGNTNGLIEFQPLVGTLVILGYSAIFLNLVFIFLSIYWWFTKKIKLIPRWVVWFNLLMFPLQLYYHFILH